MSMEHIEETPPAKEEFYIPGSLTIHVQKDKEPIRQLHNLDGLRICEHTDTIHYTHFDGRSWVKNVLEGYKLKAMRSNWGHHETVNATYSFTLYFAQGSNPLEIIGVKLSILNKKKEVIEYSIGDVTTEVSQTAYYGTPQPCLSKLINVCMDEIKTCGFLYDELLIEQLSAFGRVSES